MDANQKHIAVVGSGYWGKNLVRNFHELGRLYAICDSEPATLEHMAQTYQVPKSYTEYSEVLSDPQITGVVLATPAETHFKLVKDALKAGKDVLVEKPLALTLEEGEELIRIAESEQRILMVDHLLQYHPAVSKLKEMIDDGQLGKLLYIYSNRLNMGLLRASENILWSFAPHDISVILKLTDKEPKSVKVFGEAYLQEDIYDTTITYLSFGDRLKAHIYVSWLHPYKEQKLIVIGNYGMAVFDDMEPENKLAFYKHKIDWIKQQPVACKGKPEYIPIDKKEPLKEACLHFLDCMETRSRPRTDGHEALAVLKVLQQAQDYIDAKKSIEK